MQQYIVAENGANNARNGGDCLDGIGLSMMIMHFVTRLRCAERLCSGRIFETCSDDNANTDTINESRNCWLSADMRDLDNGCHGGAWRTMSETPVLNDPPTGEYTEVWHEDKLPQTFTPPAGTTKVEVAALISGHGFGSDTENCAEFCDHQHRFWIQYGVIMQRSIRCLVQDGMLSK